MMTDAQAPAGFLLKQSKSGMMMQKKFFVLDIDALVYGKDFTSVEAGDKKNKRLPCSQMERVVFDGALSVEIKMKDSNKHGKTHSYHGRTYLLKAEKSDDAKKWTEHLQHAMHPPIVPDLYYFTFIGGKVLSQSSDVATRRRASTSASSTASQSKRRISILISTRTVNHNIERPVPSKPVELMTPEELEDWEEKLRRYDQKVNLTKMVAVNFEQKKHQGFKPPPTHKGGALGRAKKMVAEVKEKILSPPKKPANAPPKNENQKDHQARVAVAQGYLTGGATANLGKEIANSKLTEELAKKREVHAKKMAEEEEQRNKKKAEEEKKKGDKPKGLADFIQKTEAATAAKTPAAVSAPESPKEDPAQKLKAFIATSTPTTPPAHATEETKPAESPSPSATASTPSHSKQPSVSATPKRASLVSLFSRKGSGVVAEQSKPVAETNNNSNVIDPSDPLYSFQFLGGKMD